jgi:hypothetical protein
MSDEEAKVMEHQPENVESPPVQVTNPEVSMGGVESSNGRGPFNDNVLMHDCTPTGPLLSRDDAAIDDPELMAL